MPIPKIITQTHRSPEVNQALRVTWINANPGFKYFFYDDEDCRKIVSKFYPHFLESYDKLPLKAQKADFFRYMAIHLHGGVYADVDTICKAPLESYINFESESMVVGIEMLMGCYKRSMNEYLNEYFAPEQFSQYVFAAAPRHPVLQALLLTIHSSIMKFTDEQLRILCRNHRFVLDLTGPFAFTRAVNFQLATQPDHGIFILPQLSWGYARWHNPDIHPMESSEVKVIHLCEGSWREPPATGKPQLKPRQA